MAHDVQAILCRPQHPEEVEWDMPALTRRDDGWYHSMGPTGPSLSLSKGPDMIKTGSWSPWGTIDSVTPVGDEGAAFVTTPGHGGMYLPFLLAKQMPAYLVEASFLGTDTWWEEDCDAAWPVLVLGLGSGQDMIRAAEFLKTYKPDVLATWQQDDSLEARSTA